MQFKILENFLTDAIAVSLFFLFMILVLNFIWTFIYIIPMWKVFSSELKLSFSQETHIPEQVLNYTSMVASKAAYIKKKFGR